MTENTLIRTYIKNLYGELLSHLQSDSIIAVVYNDTLRKSCRNSSLPSPFLDRRENGAGHRQPVSCARSTIQKKDRLEIYNFSVTHHR